MEAGAEVRVFEVKNLNKSRLKELLTYEWRTFGASGLDQFTLPVVARHGKIYVLEAEVSDMAEDTPGGGPGGGSPAGLAYFIRDWDDPGLAFLHGFSIAENYRGRGLGREFFRRVAELLRASGIKRVRLTVSPDNKGAMSIYEGLGFRRLEFRPDEYGTGEDRWLMELELGDPRDE